MKDRQKILSDILRASEFSGFERDVYSAVSRIPKGEVRSYSWVARKIHRPGAARAVGNALNKNRFTDIIPCHRVIRSDGSIGGYTKGAALKANILRREGINLEEGICTRSARVERIGPSTKAQDQSRARHLYKTRPRRED